MNFSDSTIHFFLNHNVVTITDKDGNITYANDKFIEVSGYSREELIGNNHSIIKSGDHPSEFYKHLWDQISLGNTWNGKIKNRSKNGVKTWFDTTIYPIDENGNRKYFCIQIPIETHLDEQLLLDESADSLHCLIDLLPNIAYFVIDNEQDIYKSGGIELKVLERKFLYQNKNFQVEIKTLLSPFIQLALNGTDGNENIIIQNQTYSLQFFCNKNHLKKIIGVNIILSNVQHTIDLHKNMEKKDEVLKTVTENLPNGSVYYIDPNERYLAIGGEELISMGFSSEGMVGRTIEESFGKELADNFRPFFERGISGERFEYTYEYKNQHYIHKIKPIIVDTRIQGVLVFQFNISQLKQNEIKLEDKNQKLNNFAFTASHDLRNPVANLKGIIDKLKQNQLNADETVAAINLLSFTVEEIDNVIHELNFIIQEHDNNQIEYSPNHINFSKTLFIDDDLLTNTLNSSILKHIKPDIEVSTIENSKKALETILKEHPSLILLDINMPDINGWDVLELMQKENIKITVIMLSSSIDVSDKLKAQEYSNVAGFISKPLTKEKIDSLESFH